MSDEEIRRAEKEASSDGSADALARLERLKRRRGVPRTENELAVERRRDVYDACRDVLEALLEKQMVKAGCLDWSDCYTKHGHQVGFRDARVDLSWSLPLRGDAVLRMSITGSDLVFVLAVQMTPGVVKDDLLDSLVDHVPKLLEEIKKIRAETAALEKEKEGDR